MTAPPLPTAACSANQSANCCIGAVNTRFGGIFQADRSSKAGQGNVHDSMHTDRHAMITPL